MIDKTFLEKLRAAEKLTVARAISVVENRDESSFELLEAIRSVPEHSYRIGITGPPGAGKSTIVSKLARRLDEAGKTVGIIAVDPTSPFTGGALLGDRVRMMDLSSHEGVFIRSMATRGSLGGLSTTAQLAADVLEAAGFDFIFLETVGVGQSELDVVEAADSTIVVLTPESGDSIQAMKAGLMEIADIFVLNKADRPGVDQTSSAISTVLQISSNQKSASNIENVWAPIIVKSVARENRGIDQIQKAVEKHRDFLHTTGRLPEKRKHRMKKMVIEMVDRELHDKCWTTQRIMELDQMLEEVMSHKLSVYQLVKDILQGSH